MKVIGDPPFYLTRRSEEDECRPGLPCKDYENTDLFARSQSISASLSCMESFGSTSEDFRSVIDDLTVENQKLKQRLRAYERFYTSHLPGEKLFEVRVHGLPPSKKRKLEETLRAFASSIDDSSETMLLYADQRLVSPLPHQHLATMPKRSSASTNNSLPVDSAYASLSTSGHASTTQCHTRDTDKLSHSVLAKNQNITSYLEDIPEGLCSKYSLLMTEKSRKKLVVKRLEQLFTGTRASFAKHSQSEQQQEVSESAAEADRSAVEARGQTVGIEGHREARILSPDKAVLADQMIDYRPPLPRTSTSSDESSAEISWSSSATPDQRPTRPLDLDPNRAQVAAENMEYIRHLGVASPELDPESSVCDGDGWVYLNLLIGMAQLHTINVTPDFVRKAVSELSEKFELSEDSRKIRWRGGIEGTRMSSDGCSSEESNTDESVDGVRPANDFGKTKCDTFGLPTHPGSRKLPHQLHDDLSADFDLGSEGRFTKLDPGRPGATLHYEPLFRRANKWREEKAFSPSDNDTLLSSGLLRDCTLNNFTRCQSRDNGPMIFYHGANFYTDLSGDISDRPYNIIEYNKVTTGVVGYTSTRCEPTHMSCDVISPSMESSKLATGRENDAQFIDTVLKGFETPHTLSDDNVYSELAPIPLDASGISGIEPSDNFAINVQVKYITVREELEITRSCSSMLSYKQKGGRPLFTHDSNTSMDRKSENTLRVRSELFSTRKVVLSPATLPPPSYVYMPSSSSSSESDIGDIAVIFAAHGQATRFPHINATDRASPMLRYSFSRKITQESTKSDSDGSSIDMLAHARQIDPDTVAAQEREFDTVQTEPAFAHITTASLAATVGNMSWSVVSE